MGVQTHTTEAESSVPPTRLFKAFCLDSHNLFPKLFPESFKRIDFVEGDRIAVGCIKQVTFAGGQGCRYSKYRIDGLDEENFYFKNTNIEDDIFGDQIDCVVHEVKCEVSSGSGSIWKLTTTVHTKGDAVLDDDKIKIGCEKKLKMFKAVEEYLVANPQVYA